MGRESRNPGKRVEPYGLLPEVEEAVSRALGEERRRGMGEAEVRGVVARVLGEYVTEAVRVLGIQLGIPSSLGKDRVVVERLRQGSAKAILAAWKEFTVRGTGSPVLGLGKEAGADADERADGGGVPASVLGGVIGGSGEEGLGWGGGFAGGDGGAGED